MASVWEAPGALADLLRLLRRPRGPALTPDALSGLADRAAVQFPRAVVAVCGGRTGATVSRFSPQPSGSVPPAAAQALPSGRTSSVQRRI